MHQDIPDAAFPHRAGGTITVRGGLPVRRFRISFSGERVEEIAVPTRCGDALVREMMRVGEHPGVTPYGTEALGNLRVEKAHVAANEFNGRIIAPNLGLGRMVSQRNDAIGVALSQREELVRADGLRLVGVRPARPSDALKAGSHFVVAGRVPVAAYDDGRITLVAVSPHPGRQVALGFLMAGAAWRRERLRAVNLLSGIEVEVVAACQRSVRGACVAERRLTALTALGAALPREEHIRPLRLLERTDVALASFAIRRGRDADPAARATQAGIPLPSAGQAAQDGP